MPPSASDRAIRADPKYVKLFSLTSNATQSKAVARSVGRSDGKGLMITPT
jgi:hypothetical protein